MSENPSVPDPARVLTLLRAAGCPWPKPAYVESTESTNTDAVKLVRRGAVDGTCLVAGEQTAGRGRHGRTWVSQPGAGLWSSTIVRGVTSPTRLPLVAALSVVDVGLDLGDLSWSIKWPNDVLSGTGRKVAGILAEGVADAVVVGIGINIQAPPAEFAGAGCWVDEAPSPDQSSLLAGLLIALHTRLHRPWPSNLEDYRAACRTIGTSVHVVLPDGEQFDGTGIDVDDDGHLLVRTGQTLRMVVAGDVLHATIAP